MSLFVTASPAGVLMNERAHLRRHRWLFFALGLVAVIVGVLAINFAFIATMAKVFVYGILVLVAGFTELIHAFMVRNLRGFALHLLAAALYLFVGVFMLEDPVRAATVLTLLLAAVFFVGGLLRMIFSVAMRFPAWPWVLLNGVIDLVLGVLVFSGWPETSLWVLGVFIGIDLLLHGWSWIILALTVRPDGEGQIAQGIDLASPVGGAREGQFRA
jgi:uncharacterized membrane protein HdeD (DUF308 family)